MNERTESSLSGYRMPISDQERRALACLEHPEAYPMLAALGAADCVVRVWQYLALGTYSSWLLYMSDGEFHVRRLEWDRSGSVIGEPIVYGSEAIVPSEAAALLMRRLREITLPPFAEPVTAGIDGAYFGVETLSGYLDGRLSWWERPPDNWKAIAEWLADVVELFDSLLPVGTARMNDRG